MLISLQVFSDFELKFPPRLIFIFILTSVICLLLSGCQDPPVSSLEKAKIALKQAADAGALRYNVDQYRLSEDLLKKGWMEMARQKGRLAPFRNYHIADSILTLANSQALEAAKLTRMAIDSLGFLARSDRDNLQAELRTWREALDGSLENFRAEHYWSAADMALKTSQALISIGEFESAREAVKSGKDALEDLENSVAEYANEEAQKIGVWRSWVDATLNESRTNGSYALIIEKSSHRAYLVSGGKLVRTYNCELGYNSARQKLFSGDGATPEGMYYVTKVKYNSKFRHALLIDYPNAMDIKRFRDNKSKGIISRFARIGALIEIHGEGGKQEDWTDGCVALSNKDIDHLMQYAQAGTPVTIVRKSDRWP